MLIVTIHAFERLEERFPGLIEGKNDIAQAWMVHEEVMDAIDAGRQGKIPPLELAAGPERWMTRDPDSFFAWTSDKKRGYLMRDTDEGLMVVTVLIGMPIENAYRKLQKKGR